MATCDACGKAENMPYNCRHCGGTFCAEHRLPENHDCPGLRQWNDPSGVFDSGFDDSVNDRGGSSGGVLSKLRVDTGPGSVFGYFRGNVTYLVLVLMWATFFAQQVVLYLAGPQAYYDLFTLTTWSPEYVWTWITSIFAHGGLYHIAGNSIVLFFFGPLVERYVGSRNFAILFLVSGALAGLGQVGISLVQGDPSAVLGASGAALAIMGVLTVLNPDLKVYLYFIFPVSIWMLTAGYAAISVLFLSTGGGGPIAHGAHLIGLAVGLAYGRHVKRNRDVRAPNQIQFGGGGGGPGGPGRGRGPF